MRPRTTPSAKLRRPLEVVWVVRSANPRGLIASRMFFEHERAAQYLMARQRDAADAPGTAVPRMYRLVVQDFEEDGPTDAEREVVRTEMHGPVIWRGGGGQMTPSAVTLDLDADGEFSVDGSPLRGLPPDCSPPRGSHVGPVPADSP
jgi:hypothetical protein